MKYEGLVIRPPSEADSLILQVTVGCSHNKCIFCPAYKAKRFRIKSFGEIYGSSKGSSGRELLVKPMAIIVESFRREEVVECMGLKPC